MKKLSIAAIIMLCLFVFTLSNAFAADNYSDWAEPIIRQAEELGLITESAGADYQRQLTREEFCELAINMYEKRTGDIVSVINNPFTDTDNPAILKAYWLGIISGVSNTRFDPDSLVTREQAAIIMVNAANKLEEFYGDFLFWGYMDTLPAEDSDAVSSWAIDFVKIAYANEFMRGDGTNFNPAANISSQESITLILNIYNAQGSSPEEEDNEDQQESAAATGMTTRLSVKLGCGDIPLQIGESTKLEYILNRYANVNNAAWSSSANHIATVDSSGNVRAVSRGSARITVQIQAEDRTISATKTIHVAPPVIPLDNVFINPATKTMNFGDYSSFRLWITPSTATVDSVTWSSSDSSVATVDNRGSITTTGAGTVTIKVSVVARDGSVKEATGQLTVRAPVAVESIKFSTYYTKPMPTGTTRYISASLTPWAGVVITSRSWSSSSPAVATISDSGKITAISEGQTTITYEVTDRTGAETSASFTLTVLAPVAVDSISFSTANTAPIIEGTTRYISATITPRTGVILTSKKWSSSNPSVATINESGRITAVSEGQTTITYDVTDTAAKNTTASFTLTVIPAPALASISFSSSSTQPMLAGTTRTISTTIEPKSGVTVVTRSWTSSDPTVATVSEAGRITALSPGQTTITTEFTDRLGNKVSNNFTLTVNPASILLSITISDSSSQPMFVGTARSVTTTTEPRSGINGLTRSFSSSDTSVATISDSGRISAISAGQTTITVEATDWAGNKASSSFILTVKEDITSAVSFEHASYEVNIGETIYPQIVVTPEQGIRSVTFSMSESGLASVSGTSQSVKGSKAGTATLTARVTLDDANRTVHTIQTTITVLPMPIDTLTLTATRSSLIIGGLSSNSYTFASYRITPSNASYTHFTIESSDESVVSVATSTSNTSSGSRRVTAEGVGNATVTITVYMSDGSTRTESVYFTVTAA